MNFRIGEVFSPTFISRIIVLMLLVTAVLPVSAQENTDIDLSRRISAEEMNGFVDAYISGDETYSLDRLSEMIMFLCDTSGINDVIRKIYEHGREVNSQKEMMCGSALLGILHMGGESIDSSLFYLKGSIQLREQMQKEGDTIPYMVTAVAYNGLGVLDIKSRSDYYEAGEYFLKALDIVDRGDFRSLEARVLSNLVMSHYYRSDPSGLPYAQRCLETIDKDSQFSFIGDYCMALMSYLNGRHEDAIDFADRTIKCIGEDVDYGVLNVNTKIMSYCVRARSLMELGRFEEAEISFNRAISISQEQNYGNIPDVYLGYGEFYERKKDYVHALQIYRTGLDVSRENDNKAYLDKLYGSISRTYEHLGDMDNAIRYMKMNQALKDTVYQAAKEIALSEMRAKYEVERYLRLYQDSREEQARQQEEQSRQLIVLIFTIVLLVVALLVIVLIWHLLKKQRCSYVKLVQHYQENAALRMHIAETGHIQDEDAGQPERPAQNTVGNKEDVGSEKYRTSSLSDDKMNQIYRELCRQMEEEKIYRDSELNVDKVAALLGTNRSYVSRVINEFEGINFNRYINKYRIKEAAQIMSDRNNDDPIKYICLQVGFRSHATFSKLFSDEVGVTPQNYRKIAADISNGFNINDISPDSDSSKS